MPSILRLRSIASESLSGTAGGSITFALRTGIPGPAGATGATGPNTVSDSTAVGTLTSAAADAASVLSTNAAGDAVRRIPLTTFSRSLLGLADAAAGRSALELGTASLLDAANVAKLNAANTFTASQTLNAGADYAILTFANNSISSRIFEVDGFLLLDNMTGLGGSNGFIFRLNSGNTPVLQFDGTGASISSPVINANPLRLNNIASQTGDTLQLRGVSSTSANRAQSAVNSSWATVTDASRQGQLSLGVYGIVGGTETLQTGLIVTATSGGTAAVTFPGTVALGDVTSAAATVSLWNNASNVGIGSAGLGPGLYLAFNSRLAVARDMLFAWSGVSQDSSGAVDTALARNGAGVVEVNNGTAGQFRDFLCRVVRTNPVTVAALPSAATAGEGARAFVTDADSTTFNAAAVGGGSNKVPVFSDGSVWKVG
jgi:hypothetical protein